MDVYFGLSRTLILPDSFMNSTWQNGSFIFSRLFQHAPNLKAVPQLPLVLDLSPVVTCISHSPSESERFEA